MKRSGFRLGFAGLIALGACQPGAPRTPQSTSVAIQYWPGIERTTRLAADQILMAQSVYVPIYSSIATADNARPINLAVTLTVRNLDPRVSLVVQEIRYHDADGKLIRQSLDAPVRVGPLASLDLFVRESDNSGGPSPSYLVDWAAELEVIPPIVEAVMISTAGSLGLTFTSSGRVVANQHR